MQHINQVIPKDLFPGVSGRYIHGQGTTFGYVDLKKDSTVKLHHHINEQITFILEGELEMEIGGERMILKPGNFHVITSNTPHSARALSDCIAIDVFCPVREEYRL
jgi:quercetin dioxygenase-like cupin family protein